MEALTDVTGYQVRKINKELKYRKIKSMIEKLENTLEGVRTNREFDRIAKRIEKLNDEKRAI